MTNTVEYITGFLPYIKYRILVVFSLKNSIFTICNILYTISKFDKIRLITTLKSH